MNSIKFCTECRNISIIKNIDDEVKYVCTVCENIEDITADYLLISKSSNYQTEHTPNINTKYNYALQRTRKYECPTPNCKDSEIIIIPNSSDTLIKSILCTKCDSYHKF